MTFRLGIDIGGTFTDFALIREDTNRVATYKELTSPADPSEAVLRGTAALLETEGLSMRDVTVVDHATTLVTNAVIERKGARTGMLVTEGFEDVLDIGEERRYDLFDLALKYPAPLVPRYMRRAVPERMHHSGTPVQAPDLEAAAQAVADLVERHAIRSLAVCCLHSHANPDHEQQIVATVRERFPYLYVSASADVLPFIREYYRWTTATLNAFVQPVIDRYLARLERGFAERGFTGAFHMMTSSGGTVTLETARRYPVRLLESGPAAGALMSAYHGRALGLDDLLSFDMGGTTAKGAIVQGGHPIKKYEIEVARFYENKAGSGFQVRIPTVDLVEIGSGGGSIAELDERGLIRVGPRSAGASPGPACYGLGGQDATLTDANLVLGYLDPAFFLGGRMALDTEAARRAIAERIGAPLGLDLYRAAWGIHEVINEDVARAFRVYASERGFDYRGTSMVAFGGSGPMHAARIARKLGIPRVVLPAGAGIMSALGLLVSPLAFETVRSRRMDVSDLDDQTMDEVFEPLIARATAPLISAGVPPGDLEVRRKLDMRYVGQGHEIEVQLPDGPSAQDLAGLFADVYRRVFSSLTLPDPMETVNWKVEAKYDRGSDERPFELANAPSGRPAETRIRQAYFADAGGPVPCHVFDRGDLSAGARIAGPALIEERESTYVIGPRDSASVDLRGNVVIDIGQGAEP